ncbi:MAG: hypothetical protein Q8P67_24395 [archaeon]|nr:hypothetical protein [archaeon]
MFFDRGIVDLCSARLFQHPPDWGLSKCLRTNAPSSLLVPSALANPR